MAKDEAAQAGGYQIIYRKAADLVPYARNSRTHSDEQVAKIMASLTEFGWTNPVLLDGENGIVAGHGRVMAALRLYEQDKAIKLPNGEMMTIGAVPTIDCSGWTDAQKRAYIIADNALAAEAGWDANLLKLELDDLTSLDFNLDLLGFSADNLAAALGPNGGGGSDVKELLTDPDDAPDLPEKPVTVLGDVWLMGSHRLVCGDSTDADVVAKCLNGITPLLMVTDPPYGVEYDADFRNQIMRKDGEAFGGRAVGKVMNDNRADWREAWSLFPGDVAYVWHAGVHAAKVAESLEVSGFAIRSQIIWAKSNFAIGRGHYHWQHEPCWYAVRGGRTGHWGGDRKQTTLWQIPKPSKSETGHSTQKPVECMRRPMENNSAPGQPVYEPFMGSGTSLIACEQIGRVSLGVELSPAYVDVAVMRWQDATGQTARLESTGHTFVELMAERVPEAVIRPGPPAKEKKKKAA